MKRFACAALALNLSLFGLTACGQKATSADTGDATDPIVRAAFSAEAEAGGLPGAPVDPHTLKPSELQFGRSPQPDPHVVYQPNVLIMPHGDTAIRSMESNGLVWHFDPAAPQVDQIQTGTIVFATERCVGEVLGVARTATDVAVLLGPVQLTDVIKEGHFVYDQPLDLNSIIAVPAPQFPGSTPDDGQTAFSPAGARLVSVTYGVVAPSGRWNRVRTIYADRHGRLNTARASLLEPASRRAPARSVPELAQLQVPQAPALPQPPGVPQVPGAPQIPAPPVSLGDLSTVDVDGGLDVLPCLSGCGGWGVKMVYDKQGIKIIASAVFFLRNPRVAFNIDLSNGVKTVALRLEGAAGFQTHFEMGTDSSFAKNIHKKGILPLDLSIPISPMGGVPLGIHLIQELVLATGFSARTSVLQSDARYAVCCHFMVGYINQRWGYDPVTISQQTDLAAGVNGISVGINSVVFALRQEILVGIGMGGFSAGPYMALDTNVTALKQSDIAMVQCRQGTFGMGFSAGVGWTLPKIFVAAVNALVSVLHIFGAKVKPIPPSGSFLEMKPLRMVDIDSQQPPRCATPK
jgi:hypothetical protein